jgi:hypothetical protein
MYIDQDLTLQLSKYIHDIILQHNVVQYENDICKTILA